MSDEAFDLFVIGAGSGGVRAARCAAARGVRVAVAEAGRLGGTCVNLGCVPKKLLMHGSAFSAAFEDARGYGWQHPGPPTHDWPAMIAAKDREIERLNGIYQRLLEESGVTLIRGRATLCGGGQVEVDGRRYRAEQILLATGGRPVKPDVPGSELAIVSDDAFYLPSLPRRAVVLGGGYIGIEFAGIFHHFGSQVVQIHRRKRLLRGWDEDVREVVTDLTRARGIDLRTECTIEKLERAGDAIAATLDDGSVVETDVVLCATGREPLIEGLGLEEAGVAVDAGGAVVVNAYSATSAEGVWAIGDCTDRVALTPVAIAEAEALVRTLYDNQPTAMDYGQVPSAVFGQPPAASVGMSEQQAAASGLKVRTAVARVKPLTHALAGRDERALLKLVVDARTDRVVGVHMVGPEAAEVVQALAVAMRAGATAEDFASTLALHPTLSEEWVSLKPK